MSTERPEPAGARGQPSAQDTGSATGHDDLAVRLGELARSLEQQEGSERTLARIVRSAITLIPGVQEGSISVVTSRRHVTSQAASGQLAEQVDALQAEVGEGPCLSAVYEEQTVRVPDMAVEERWPRFAQRASAAGVGAMLSFQLFVQGDNLGALNLYARSRGAFDDESEHVGLLFATHAAVAFAAAQQQGQLRASVATRDLIGMAKGILVERYKITGERAFAVLVQASQDTNRKLREVADELVHSGQMPQQAPTRR